MKVDGALKSLLQGVSQQPIRERLAGQCTEQINFSADPVTGLTRRPPTDLVDMIASDISESTPGNFIDFRVQSGKGFFAHVGNGGVRVWDLNGNQKTVTVPVSTTYFNGDGPFVHTVVGNDIFLVNRSIKTAMTTEIADYPNTGPGRTYFGAVVQFLGGAYGREYVIYINGNEAGLLRAPPGTETVHTSQIRSSILAAKMRTALTTTTDGNDSQGMFIRGTSFMADTNEWIVARSADSLSIRRVDGTPFSISVADDAGGTTMAAITDVGEGLDKLPRSAPNRHAVRIAENTDSDYDMWMVFETELPYSPGGGFGSLGFWKETVAPNVPTTINATTMPHKLVYNPDTDSFTLTRVTWDKRDTGNEISNPDPSFIGNTINDISLFQSRLVLVSGNYLIMSRTNRLGNFFIGSLTELVDTDPIDIGSNAQEASALVWIVPHNKDLAIFSPSAQFLLYGRQGINPSNASLALTTVFESDIRAKPISCGKNVFFANTFGRYSGVREFFTEISGEVNDTRTITPHVKKYIEGRVTQFSASSNYDMLLTRATGDSRTVYLYQFIWADSEKVQSAWSKYIMPHAVRHMFFDESVVYFIMQTEDGPALARMFLDVEESAGMSYGVHLDYRFDVFDVHTQFTLPDAWLSDFTIRAVQGEECPNPGMPVPIQSIVWDAGLQEHVVTLKYDMLGGDIICGVPYRSSYIPTPPMIKDEGKVAIANAKLKLKHWLVSVANTGHLSGRKLSKYGEYPTVEFIGRIVGDIDNLIGHQVLSDGKFVMPFRELSTLAEVEFFTDSPFPATLLDIEWVGQYWKSGRRIDTGD